MLAALVLAIALPRSLRQAAAAGPTVWQQISNSPTTNNLYAVTITSSTSGWAVGDLPPFASGSATILQFTGNQSKPWIVASGTSSLAPNPLHALAVDPATGNVWAVGEGGTTVHFVASTKTWSVVNDSATTDQLNGVAVVSDNDVWAVSGVIGPPDSGTIIHFDGTSWTSVQTVTGSALFGISMVSSTDGWIVGEAGTILRFNGSTWNTVTPPTGDDYEAVAIDASSSGTSTDGWIVGSSGALLHFNGTNWSSFTPSPTSNELLSVAMVSPSAGWAVGLAGVILQWDGTTWSSVSSPVTQQYPWAVGADSSGDAWIVGSDGTILQNVPAPTPTITNTPTITDTPTQTGTSTTTPTITDTPTVTDTATNTPTPTNTSTSTETPTVTATRTFVTPTRSPTSTRTATEVDGPTNTPTNHTQVFVPMIYRSAASGW
jgi:photosystem II stability/assembly factor-like uncharacterized protein